MNQDQMECLTILDKMEIMLDAEMLMTGVYLSGVEKPERAGEICEGRYACAIGSLYLAGKVKFSPSYDYFMDSVLERRRSDGTPLMHDGTDGSTRYEYNRMLKAKYPLVAATLTALNQASQEMLDAELFGAETSSISWGNHDPLEALFESNWMDWNAVLKDPTEPMRWVLNRARDIIKESVPVV